MIKDPVCGMAVDRKNPPARAQHGGKEYLFCSAGCKEAFEKDPGKYLRETDVRRSEQNSDA